MTGRPPYVGCRGCESFIWGEAPGWIDWRHFRKTESKLVDASAVMLFVRCDRCNPDGKKPVPHWPLKALMDEMDEEARTAK